MTLDRQRLGKITKSLFDQAWLSGINFAISLLLIHLKRGRFTGFADAGTPAAATATATAEATHVG